MNWVKENKFLTGFIVVMLIGIGVLGYEVYSASSAYDDATDGYTKAAGEYNRLRHLVPFPNKQNLAGLRRAKGGGGERSSRPLKPISPKKEFPLDRSPERVSG